MDGLHYLQTYERLLIRAIVTVAYTGWVAYASLFIFRPLDSMTNRSTSSRVSTTVTSIAGISLAGFWILFFIQRSPWTFYLYTIFPCYFWHQFMVQAIPALFDRQKSTKRHINYYTWLTGGVMIVGVLQGMVVRLFSYNSPYRLL